MAVNNLNNRKKKKLCIVWFCKAQNPKEGQQFLSTRSYIQRQVIFVLEEKKTVEVYIHLWYKTIYLTTILIWEEKKT